MVERILIRHSSGTKLNQTEQFATGNVKELLIGRDAVCSILYDQAKDDMVSRLHAKIVPDSTDPDQFWIEDLQSRNGTFVNRQRISARTRLSPGDTVQFGAGGPELIFDIEPRPVATSRPTREVGISAPPLTRESSTGTAVAGAAGAASTGASSGGQVGRTTVERLIFRTKQEANTRLFAGVGVLAVILAAAVGLLLNNQNRLKQQTNAAIVQTGQDIHKIGADLQQTKDNQPLTPTQIQEQNNAAVVKVEFSWKLIHTPTGKQLYQRYDPRTGEPIYVTNAEGKCEPRLTLNGDWPNQPIGGSGSGSGFVVKSDGFILTCRHVAASWMTIYPCKPGVLLNLATDEVLKGADGQPVHVQPPTDWVPANTKQFKSIEGSILEGRHDYLYVVLPNTSDRINAHLIQPSNEADVALIKIDVPQTLKAVTMYDAETAKKGDAIVVMGYPGVASKEVSVKTSVDSFNREADIHTVADPVVTPGTIQKLSQDSNSASRDRQIISEMGNMMELTANATGRGNSGGPVFDDQGRVIGIFAAGKTSAQGDATVTFALPIRYGTSLMGTSAVK